MKGKVSFYPELMWDETLWFLFHNYILRQVEKHSLLSGGKLAKNTLSMGLF